MSDMKTEKLATLYPLAQQKMLAFITAANSKGYNIGAFETLRTFAKQEQYYQEGRSVPGKIITNSEPGLSWHQYGAACDIAFIDENGNWDWPPDDDPRWIELGQIGQSMGLEWGGSFPIKDLDHFQLTGGMNIQDAYNAFMAAGLSAVQIKLVSA